MMQESDFNWQTHLTKKRRRAIAKWFNSLTPDKQEMVCELQEDHLDDHLDSINPDL